MSIEQVSCTDSHAQPADAQTTAPYQEVRYSEKEIRNRYLKYGIAIPFLPVILTIIYDVAVGYSFPQAISNHFTDFYIIIFTTAASIINTITCIKTCITKMDKANFLFYAFFSAIVSIGFFALVYLCPDIEGWFAWFVYFINWGILLYNICLGIKIEKINNIN